MPLTIDLSPDIVRRVREEAARKGQAPEDFLSTMVTERFRAPGERARRVAALLDQWDAEDDAEPLAGPVAVQPRATLRTPDVG